MSEQTQPADWMLGLPAGYAGQVVAPARLEHFEEPSAHAEKVLGNDAHGQCCYHLHRYALTRLVLDDEDNFQQEETYWEEVRAWRLRAGGWLRCEVTAGNAGVCRDRRLEPRYAVTPERPW